MTAPLLKDFAFRLTWLDDLPTLDQGRWHLDCYRLQGDTQDPRRASKDMANRVNRSSS